MNALNIDLSLTIYSIMMELSPNNIKFRVALLNEIFTNLEEKLVNSEIKNTDKDDPEFFKNCLLIASVAQSESLLDRMMEIYNHRNNRVKIVSPSDEARFFENYLSSKLCCLTLNNFLIVYKKFVPNLLAFSPFIFGFITRIMHDRKPDEFSWPMLKRLTEDFVNSHCFSVTKCQTVILNHLLQVKPNVKGNFLSKNKHLSRTESEEYFTLCNRLIKNIADDEQFHAMKEKYKRNIKINNNNKNKMMKKK
ncbi:hypothetical protein Mgra_00004998 [Meloidogyne graminicola]|uniref:Uncharacterized protein n=1 Tax=Meloidogyne graminicola TaxID=189291 RepID=A0A8S9ZR27_9BILA|nr:hypothetical protein Mgra_00004998 [Meloidogyne graminicola]